MPYPAPDSFVWDRPMVYLKCVWAMQNAFHALRLVHMQSVDTDLN